MDVADTLRRLKPVVGGALGGAAVLAIVAFSFDWVYTAGATERKVETAKVQTLAEVCESNAEHHWTKDENKKMAALDGWDNAHRAKLAKQFAPAVPQDAGYREQVIEACNEALEPA